MAGRRGGPRIAADVGLSEDSPGRAELMWVRLPAGRGGLLVGLSPCTIQEVLEYDRQTGSR